MGDSNIREPMVPARPSYQDIDVLKNAATEILPELAVALDCKANDHLANEIVQVMRSESDGYRMAKYGDDRFYWNANSEVVDILESAFSYLHNARETAVKRWVANNAIAVPFEPGDRVSTRRGIGMIHEVRAETAEVLIALDDETRPECYAVEPVEKVRLVLATAVAAP